MNYRRIWELRKSASMTQFQIAELLGVERSTLSCYETGKATPSLETLKKIARIFDVSIDYLANDDAPPKSATQQMTLNDRLSDYRDDIRLGSLHPDEKHLVMQYRLLSEKDRIAISKSVDECIEKYE